MLTCLDLIVYEVRSVLDGKGYPQGKLEGLISPEFSVQF